MTAEPLIEITGLTKHYQGSAPLWLDAFRLAAGQRVVITGLDAGAAEAFVLLVTGALLPEAGDVRIAGRSTREIASETEWLSSLDRFGLVTARAVLIEALPVAANLALPLTLSIDPIAADVRRRVEALAGEAGLALERLDAPAATLSADERMRVHLARALANDPDALLFEHPTAALAAPAARAFGETLRRLGSARPVGWVALTNDDAFARASGGERFQWRASRGDLVRRGWFRRLFQERG
jgi:ABC-type lipoprotein export system ATPase subunit